MKKTSISIFALSMLGLLWGGQNANAAVSSSSLTAKSYVDAQDSAILQDVSDKKSIKNNVLTDLANVAKQDVNYPTLQAAELIAETVFANEVKSLDGTATLSGDISEIKITQTNGKLDTNSYTVTVAQNAITTGKIASSDSKDASANEIPIADGTGKVTWTDCNVDEALVRTKSGWTCVGIAT